ncbi:hypothetical protein PGTUg99_032298 [Puccinia graminis f. sp. tritici]|uniref:Uncharacterized protein n=1 Tax=Puccinia graminis f. sp. tritici TaxID=56615 RepID=A0A5B0SKC0_PUCGR|nr:hypothetical protein PGTUg99_032298 [Puccinia graminis f. sp. tritici]
MSQSLINVSLMRLFHQSYISLSFLAIIIALTLNLGWSAADPTSCMPHFDSQPDQSMDKMTQCKKDSCVDYYDHNTDYKHFKFVDCERYNQPKAEVNPLHYHHYPNAGDELYVAALDSETQLWYNCAYSNPHNKRTFLCTDCP